MASRESGLIYDEGASGSIIYAYVHGNPLSYVDPLGLTEYGPITESVNDFWENYKKMREARTIGADKYFHCMANCQASKRGPVGEIVADVISETREQVDEKVKGDSRKDCDADRAANNQGQTGERGGPSCSSVCESFRPKALDPKY